MNNSDAKVLKDLINSNGHHVCLVGGNTLVTIDGYKEPKSADDVHLFYDNMGKQYEQRVLHLNIKKENSSK